MSLYFRIRREAKVLKDLEVLINQNLGWTKGIQLLMKIVPEMQAQPLFLLFK
jgi:hypothetical protein